MAVLASEILTSCATILQDDDHVRWPLAELAGWLNDALRAIILAKPSAKSESVVLAMGQGTLQELTNVSHLALLRVTRNIKTEGPPRVGGRVIRATTREGLDTSAPNWHDPVETQYRGEVRQYVYDEAVPREFYVYPGNDGTGKIEAVVSIMPALVAASGDPLLLASYAAAVDLPEPWRVVIQDFVLARAFAKDDVGADLGRAGFHFQQFASAVGIKVQVEGTNSPNTRARVVTT